MTTWSLPALLAGLHSDIQQRLETVRQTFNHSGTKGSASENVWLQLLQTYLPQRYQVATAHVVDSQGKFSNQIDVVIFDRQYSPFIFRYEGQTIVPAESIYAVFEAKQAINADEVRYAQDKVASVRQLHRTSLPIPHAGGTFAAKPPTHILGGLLTVESDWNPALGLPLKNALLDSNTDSRLDLGCVAAHGNFKYSYDKDEYDFVQGNKPATAFLFTLISELQFSGTVPMIDIQQYAQWLAK